MPHPAKKRPALVFIPVPVSSFNRFFISKIPDNASNRILLFQYPGKIFALKSLCTGSVNLK